MARSHNIKLQISTHTESDKDKVLQALKTALKPLVTDGTIWTIDGTIVEVYAPDAFTIE